MFDSRDDWNSEMKRTKGACRLVTENQSFELFPRYISVKCLLVNAEYYEDLLCPFTPRAITVTINKY